MGGGASKETNTDPRVKVIYRSMRRMSQSGSLFNKPLDASDIKVSFKSV